MTMRADNTIRLIFSSLPRTSPTRPAIYKARQIGITIATQCTADDKMIFQI